MHKQNMFHISRHFLQAIAFNLFDFAILNIQIIKHFMKNNQLGKKREQTSVEDNGMTHSHQKFKITISNRKQVPEL